MRFAIVSLSIPIVAGCAATGATSSTRPGDPRPELVSLLGRPLFAGPPAANLAKLESDLAEAERRLSEHPDDPDAVVWVGRRLGYLWRMNEAIAVFSEGIRQHRTYAPLYRHRGHRYISVRRFDDAIVDLETAARLIDGHPDQIEQDGAPNVQDIPLTTLGFNVWYHIGVARYCNGDFEEALAAFRETNKYTGGHADNLVAVSDWVYMILRRLGRDAEATESLLPISPEMKMMENHAYHRRCLMYKGLIAPDELLDVKNASDLDLATMGYGLGNWRLVNGERENAIEIFRRVTSGPYWPAFGFIAAEADLARLR
jgi:tetratricopeptide (TPR) repeat protein